MANTYTIIASNTLTGTASSVTFSGIPNSYKDLIVKWSGRDVSGSANYDYQLEFNASGGTAYSTTQLYGSGSGIFANNYSNAAYGRVGYSQASNSDSGIFDNNEIYITNYATAEHKCVFSQGATQNGLGSTAGLLRSSMASTWRDTSAITSIKISNGGTFAIGSTFWLYGIKNT